MHVVSNNIALWASAVASQHDSRGFELVIKIEELQGPGNSIQIMKNSLTLGCPSQQSEEGVVEMCLCLVDTSR